MRLIYNISVAMYGLLIRFASLFNSKAKLWVVGRQEWESKLLAFKNQNNKKLVWIHAASLGEFEQGRPIMEEIKKQYTDFGVVLSFFSPSGFEIRKNYKEADYVCYMPLDSAGNAKKFIEIMDPTIAIIVKYEFWLNHLRELNKNQIPHFLVSGIFRKSQIFFKPYGSIFRKSLENFSHLFLQDQNSLDLMDVIENSNKSISGDTRFDRVYEIRENDNNIVDIQRFKGKDLMVVIGSSWPTEEEFSLDFMATHPSCKFIIAPHNISQSAINQFINKSPLPVARYSELNKVTDINSLRVLVIDSIGLLSQIYKYADVTVIGGGFNAGIHNILEATVWGQPVMFGPKYRNFKEAQDLLTIGGALTFSDQDRFSEYLNILLENRERREEMSTLSAEYCLKNKGATQIVMETIGQYLID